jgi:hypothetical protein
MVRRRNRLRKKLGCNAIFLAISDSVEIAQYRRSMWPVKPSQAPRTQAIRCGQ